MTLLWASNTHCLCFSSKSGRTLSTISWQKIERTVYGLFFKKLLLALSATPLSCTWTVRN